MAILSEETACVKQGEHFGQLVVIGVPFSIPGKGKWRRTTLVVMECACGQIRVMHASNLRRGAQSCGCQRPRRTHGQSGTKLYECWVNMIQRCYNPKTTRYERYGGRGVRVCEEWRSFEGFAKWAEVGYAPGLELDRRDNGGNYEPSNCRWSTEKQQSRNTALCKAVEAFGETKLLVEWSEDSRCKVARGTLQTRIYRGWPAEKAITQPVR